MYENAKKFIIAWENGDPVPLDETLIANQIKAQTDALQPVRLR